VTFTNYRYGLLLFFIYFFREEETCILNTADGPSGPISVGETYGTCETPSIRCPSCGISEVQSCAMRNGATERGRAGDLLMKRGC